MLIPRSIAELYEKLGFVRHRIYQTKAAILGYAKSKLQAFTGKKEGIRRIIDLVVGFLL
jgi:hypothetical protein